MPIELDNVEALAPDQASLKAASKLLKATKWPLRGHNAATGLIWGECQGSGANPYRVMADTNDHGYKCTCPSRKFPCKHSLAIMWMFAETGGEFSAGEVPDWVSDWVGRRRKTGGAPAAAKAAGAPKNLGAATKAEPKAAPDPRKLARQKAAAEKRAKDNLHSVAGGLDELDQWIADQLRLGLAGFLNEMTERCRRIAARMVDAKAGALAGRIDEMPARILSLRAEERPDAVISEFGKLVLLARAWRLDPGDPDINRTVMTTETRESVLEDTKALRIDSIWEVLDERITTRRDGLIAQSTWLLNLKPGPQRFALLLDFFPAATGRRGSAFTAGERFAAELVFYRASSPLRALIAERKPDGAEGITGWPDVAEIRPLTLWQLALNAAPWTLSAPLLLPKGRLCQAKGGDVWWCPVTGHGPLPVAGEVAAMALGTDLDAAVVIWNGLRCDLLAARTADWGRISFDA